MYDITYNIAWQVHPIRGEVTAFSNYLVRVQRAGARRPTATLKVHLSRSQGYAGGLTSAVVVWSIREKLLRPSVPALAAVAADAPVSQRLLGALAAARHSVVHYPFTFRLTSVLICGIAGGVAHLHTQRAWTHRGRMPAAPPALLDGTSDTPSTAEDKA